MATEKWIAGSGQGLTWGTALNGSDVNSMSSGKGVLSSVSDITNGTALDIFADFSIQLGSVTSVAPNYLGIFLYPLNSDGSTYGDNQFSSGTQTSATPSPTYWVGNILFPVATAAIKGTLTRIILPPGSFRFLVWNQAGVALASSGNTLQYRTYNRSVA